MKRILTSFLAVASLASCLSVKAQTTTTPNFTVSPAVICQGTTVTFLSTTTSPHSPHLSYYWDFGWLSGPSVSSWNLETPPPVSYGGSGAPTVSLTVYDSVTGISYYYSRTITIYPVPYVTGFSPMSAVFTCPTDSVTLSATTSGTVSNMIWTLPSGATDTTMSLVAHTIGSYSVRTVNSVGCVSSGSAGYYISSYGGYFSVNAIAVSDMGGYITGDTARLCINAHPSIGVGTSFGMYPFTYSWNNGVTTPSFTPAANGNYVITATDGNGCTVKDSIYVALSASPDSTIHASVAGPACEGTTVFLSVPGSGITCLWNTGITSDTQVVTSGGTFNVAVRNTAGCVSYNSHSVGFVPSPSPTIEMSGCHLAIATLNSGSTYRWYKNSVSIPGATSQYFDANATGSGWYAADETNSTGCSALSSVLFSDCWATGITSVVTIEDIKSYPNPFSDQCSITLPVTEIFTISVTDPLGKNVLTQKGTGRMSLLTENMPKGVYFLSVADHDGKNIKHERIVKN